MPLGFYALGERKQLRAVDRCLVNDGQSQLASTRRVAAEPPTPEPARQPERQREQAEHHDHEQNDFEAALSLPNKLSITPPRISRVGASMGMARMVNAAAPLGQTRKFLNRGESGFSA